MPESGASGLIQIKLTQIVGSSGHASRASAPQ
jgi:hypothetical protein